MKKIIMTGNVGRDPEVRADQTGNQFVTFSLAVAVGTKQNPRTDWIDVTCNGKLADVAKNYVKKGTKLLVEGFPSVHAYMTKENTPAATMRVSVNNFEFLSKREEGDAEAGSSASGMNTVSDFNSPVYTLPEMGAAGSSNAMNLKSDEIPF